MNVIDKDASASAHANGKPPAHEVVYQQLREHILFGEIAPGEAVTIQGLVQTLSAGMTPVREAIRRLISDGALVFQGNRRVSVPTLSLAQLEEVDFLRKSVESQLARQAAQQISDVSIADLSRIDTDLDTAIRNGDVRGYLIGNYQFHMTLYAQANAPILHGVAERLWLRFGPSLRVVCGRFGTENLPDRHKDLLDALNARDPDAAAQAMTQDVDQGTSQMAQVVRESE